MRNSRTTIIAVAALAATPCTQEKPGGPHGASAAAPAASADDMPGGAVSVDIAGVKLDMKSAIVIKGWNGAAFTVQMSPAADLSCDKRSTDAEYLTFDVTPSSDGTFSAGKAIPMRIGVRNLKDKTLLDISEIPASYARVRIAAPFGADAPAAKVSLAFEQTREVLNPTKRVVTVKGGGTIEAKMCLSDQDKKDTAALTKPQTAPAAPVTGMVAGKPWPVKKAFAWLYRDEPSKRDVITEITLTDNADGTCEQGQKSIFEFGGIAGNQFEIHHPGITDQRKPTAVELPVQVTADTISPGRMAGTNVSGVNGTLTLSKIDLKEGGTIEGAVWMDTGPKPDNKDAEGKLVGTFTATVCTRKW